MPNLSGAGILFYAKSTKRRLFLMRNGTKTHLTWGLVGGKIEIGESIVECLKREAREEIGHDFDLVKLIPVEKFTSRDGNFCYHTFICVVEEEFVPLLNHEHIGYAWVDSGVFPKPLHPGLWSTVSLQEVREKIELVELELHSLPTATSIMPSPVPL